MNLPLELRVQKYGLIVDTSATGLGRLGPLQGHKATGQVLERW